MAEHVLRTKFTWYQTHESVIVNVMVKNARGIRLDFGGRTAKVFHRPDDGGTEKLLLALDLFSAICPNSYQHKVMESKIEFTMKKAGGDLALWSALERVNADAEGAEGEAAPTGTRVKNWDKLVNDFEQLEKEEKPDIGDVFRNLYADATDDARRAMNKSYQESRGTCLSMDWSKIKKKPTKASDDDGESSDSDSD